MTSHSTQRSGGFVPHQRRLMWIILVGVSLAVALGLILYGLRAQVTFFVTASDLVAPSEDLKKNDFSTRSLRLGGYVAPESLEVDLSDTTQGGIYRFQVMDEDHRVAVWFQGVLPDLFREGQGVVAEGTWSPENQLFTATRILAKHDETYKPPELKHMAPPIKPSDDKKAPSYGEEAR